MGLDYNSSENNRAYKDDIMSIIGTTNQQYILEEDEIKGVLRRYEGTIYNNPQKNIKNLTKYLLCRELVNWTSKTMLCMILYNNKHLKYLYIKTLTQYDYNKEVPKPYEYNDYYFPDYNDNHFDNKLGSIYAK